LIASLRRNRRRPGEPLSRDRGAWSRSAHVAVWLGRSAFAAVASGVAQPQFRAAAEQAHSTQSQIKAAVTTPSKAWRVARGPRPVRPKRSPRTRIRASGTLRDVSRTHHNNAPRGGDPICLSIGNYPLLAAWASVPSVTVTRRLGAASARQLLPRKIPRQAQGPASDVSRSYALPPMENRRGVGHLASGSALWRKNYTQQFACRSSVCPKAMRHKAA
jgi:hypothetical protein